MSSPELLSLSLHSALDYAAIFSPSTLPALERAVHFASQDPNRPTASIAYTATYTPRQHPEVPHRLAQSVSLEEGARVRTGLESGSAQLDEVTVRAWLKPLKAGDGEIIEVSDGQQRDVRHLRVFAGTSGVATPIAEKAFAESLVRPLFAFLSLSPP